MRKIARQSIFALTGILLLLLPISVFGDVFYLKTSQTMNGIVLSETSTMVEIQTVSARINLPLSRVSSWTREPNLQSYYRLSQEALGLERFSVARDFMKKSLTYDPQNAALQEKFSEIEYAEVKKNQVDPILKSISGNKMDEYLKSIKELEDLVKENEKQNYVQNIKHDLADVRVKYALYLYNFVRNDEAYEQLRLARRMDENNENLHLALAKIQSLQGNEVLAQLEQDQAREVAQEEKEKQETLHQILASVEEPGCDDIPSAAYWTEQARLASLRKTPNYASALDLIPVEKPLRVLLQAYNAGPGAVVVYDGKVPYKETVNYIQSISGWMNRVGDTNGYESLIQKYSRKYNLDPEFVKALIKVESDFNPRARSKADARGLMQLTATTWRDTVGRLGVNWSFSKHAYDPEKNLEVGCHYLSWLKNDFLPKYFDMASANTGTPYSRTLN